MAEQRLNSQTYRIADNGEWIKIAEGREEHTGFFYVRGGRLSA